MADQADDAQDYLERAFAEFQKRKRERGPEASLPLAECDLCGEVSRILNDICIPCRDRYRL